MIMLCRFTVFLPGVTRPNYVKSRPDNKGRELAAICGSVYDRRLFFNGSRLLISRVSESFQPLQ
jgi:hypothetical protein